MIRRLEPVPIDAGQENHPPETARAKPPAKSIAQILLDEGDIEPVHLIKSLARQRKQDTPVERILLAHGWVTPQALVRAQSIFWQSELADPAQTPPDPELVKAIGIDYCLSRDILPLSRTDDGTLIATCRPGEFAEVARDLASDHGQIRMVLCTEAQIQDALLSIGSAELIRAAEYRVPKRESCRSRPHKLLNCLYVTAIAALAYGFWAAPSAMQIALISAIFAGLVLQSGLKLACLLTALATPRPRHAQQEDDSEDILPLPDMSVIVPLYKEAGIARDLVSRLLRLRYPRELTDIVLAVETGDRLTKSALAGVTLPPWIRVIELPEGSVRTKPRALNYALKFCKGAIIGVWDAEDQPAPDQLHRIARHFHHARPDLGCVQGILDYYNPRTNHLARFFTIEYAAWFRVMLPAMARMGLVIPLGGTTCFFRREALEQSDAWDAWNVTEDADLGVRLARRGWRTEITRTVTNEEANCRMIPWVKQRSRWFKGYAMTWGVHMRNPWRLWRDLGTRRFIGFQVQFFFMLSQHLLVPAIWGFWLVSFGLSFPLHDALPVAFGPAAPALFLGLLLCAEALGILLNTYATRAPKHRHLRPWVPFMIAYFPLAGLAAWKSAMELLGQPYYWDKTAHGIFASTLPPSGGVETIPDTVSVPVMGQIGDEKPAPPLMDAGDMWQDEDGTRDRKIA
ncbi:glycosyltransferase [Paracoccus onubensis]|uniref:Glycosyltransferase n=1 Tax=Paracoccus onubensis TaxID=1675788 RepID=A0A418SXN9_9RHOB|nr:glycosyltransferase [Paracoccus onubensis]RJE85729.1 glycosyltransferase [Paracoccus onubensis]